MHPSAFFGVPRVWEKIKTGISAKLAADPNPDNVKLVEDSMAAGLAWVSAQEVGGVMTPEIEEAYRKADEAILGFLKLLLGIDQVQWAGSAAAPMPIEVARFMAGLGLKVFDVYGMTETCGAVTANGPDGFKLGTVGRATPGMEIRLGEDQEILVRGPVVTPGYHRQEEATRALIGGWRDTPFGTDEAPVELSLANGMTFDLDTAAYVRDWAIPQFYFHLMTAYSILRAAGVPLGKADYVGFMFRYLRQPPGA